MFFLPAHTRKKGNSMGKLIKPKLWMGLSSVGILLTTVLFAGRALADDNAGLINDVLNLSTQKISSIDSDEIEGTAYHTENGSLCKKGWEQLIAESYQFCEEAVEQGAVLLKNSTKNNKPVLPLEKNERKVTLLGQGSKNLFMRSGAGGAAPNESYLVNLDKAFTDNGFTINDKVWEAYSTLDHNEMTNPATKVEHDFEGFYTQALKDSFAQFNHAAIITFVRIGTENSDPPAGQLDLNNDEKELLKMVKASGVFNKVIVLINSPLPMSMDWVDKEEYGVDACVWMGVPGYYGAGGIVHVLAGERPKKVWNDEKTKLITIKDNNGDLVMEKVNPSGHLPDTFAASASSSPAYQNFGDPNLAVYQEGVYVGYKYYETRYADGVLGQGNALGTKGVFNSATNWNYAEEMGYPFGFGLSYSDFSYQMTNLEFDASKDVIKATVKVTNNNAEPGKASVQIYVQQPYTNYDKEKGLGKSAIALMGYEKVDVEGNASVDVTVEFDRYQLCTYDYVGYKTYILEEGKYYFAVGNGAHEALNNILSVASPGAVLVDHNGATYTGKADAVKTLDIAEDTSTYAVSHYDKNVQVTNRFDDADYNYMAQKNGKEEITYLSRTDWEGTWPTTQTENPATSADSDMSQYYKITPNTPAYEGGDKTNYNVAYKDENGVESKITFYEMSKVPLKGKVTDENSRFFGQEGSVIWDAFIKQMDLNDLIISVSDNRGILDVKKVVKKGNSVAEGPEGLLSKFQYGDKRWGTGFPTGPTYTATFDKEMQKKFGGFYGEEALYCGVACVNAPGANINRTPYGSRASEYMSEDGILNYNVASNIISEARRKGLIMNIKHCFLNNQETGRQGIFTYCNEQAIREIYLKPFEGALTKGRGLGIMTSYNRIGARYAAVHEPLMLNVMRGEWAYQGLIIDDALSGNNTHKYSNGPAMIHCGTDLFCLDGTRGKQLREWVTANNDGQILKDLQRANKYVMYSMSRSWMGGIDVNEDELGKDPWWKVTINAITIGIGTVTALLFGMYIYAEIMSKKKVVAE